MVHRVGISIACLALVAHGVLISGCTSRPFEMARRFVTLEDEASFPQTTETKVDLLFVVDSSASMTEEQEKLQNSFLDLLDALKVPALQDDLPDLRIGVMVPDIGDNTGISGPCKPKKPKLLELESHRAAIISGGDKRYIQYSHTNKTVNVSCSAIDNQKDCFSQAFKELASVGTQGCSIEQHLEATKQALDPQLNLNEGFLRPDVLLGIVFVTDEDDCSANSEYTTFFGKTNDAMTEFGKYGTRCLKHGLRCKGPAAQFDNQGVIEGCEARENDSEYVYGVDRYKQFFSQLRGNRSRVVMAAIAAPVPLDKKIHLKEKSCAGQLQGCTPQLRNSTGCIDPNDQGQVAEAAIRIGNVVKFFGGTTVSVCGEVEMYKKALQVMGKRIVAKLEGQCIERPLLLPNNAIACSKEATACKDLMPNCPEDQTCDEDTGTCVRDGNQTESPCGETCLDKVECRVEVRSGHNLDQTPKMIERCERRDFVSKRTASDICAENPNRCPCWRVVYSQDCAEKTDSVSPFALEIMRAEDKKPAPGDVAALRCQNAAARWSDVDANPTSHAICAPRRNP